jgi:hypothetical protein
VTDIGINYLPDDNFRLRIQALVIIFGHNKDELIKSHVPDGFVKSSRSRLAKPEE